MGDRALKRRRVLRRLITPIVVAAVVLPAVSGDDSFPISTYPMYAFLRPRTDRFQTVLGETSTGTVRSLPIRVIADTDDPLIAAALVRTAIRGGGAAVLCAQVAQRVGADVIRVLVVEEVHDVVARARRSDSVQQRVVHASCAVPR